MKKAHIVREYIDRFPNINSLTLAKLLVKDKSEYFYSTEQARNVVRFVRGKKGRGMRVADLEKYEQSYEDRLKECERVMPSHSEEWTDFIIPELNNDVLILADLHIPYHDPAAIRAALKWGLGHKVNTIILNGDVMDCYQASTWLRKPTRAQLRREIEMAGEFFDLLDETFPNAKKYWKFGNHEERWEKLLLQKAPELFDINEFRLDVVMKCGERGIDVIREQRKVKAGKVYLLHGHETGRGSYNLVNPARTAFLRTKSNTIISHFHQTSEHSETNLKEEIIACWSTGCLCELHPEYARINKWNHGFARLRFTKDDFRVTNLRIYNGSVL